MLLDPDRGLDDLDLLDDAGSFLPRQEAGTTVGTRLERVIVDLVDLVRPERLALVFRMPRLAALLALALLLRWLRSPRRLDDVAGRRLGRSRGVLSSLGEVSFEFRDPLLLRGDQLVLVLDTLAESPNFRQDLVEKRFVRFACRHLRVIGRGWPAALDFSRNL